MNVTTPRIVVLCGPNGSGKSTSAERLFRGPLEVEEFVNADTIAKGLSAFSPEQVSLAAGRIMVRRLRELAESRAVFAFETTLAARSFAPWLQGLRATGYQVQLIYLWLTSPEVAISRVADRVRAGGHHVPDDVVRRRYFSGLVNLRALYIPLADQRQVVDNGDIANPRVIASGAAGIPATIHDNATWQSLLNLGT